MLYDISFHGQGSRVAISVRNIHPDPHPRLVATGKGITIWKVLLSNLRNVHKF
jgi:hypothetical protein